MEGRLLPNAAALFVGQDSTSPAADVHVDQSGSWRTRADLEVRPTTAEGA
jgi:hypothetical protein